MLSLPYFTKETKISTISTINMLLGDNSSGYEEAETNRSEVATLIQEPSLSYPHLYFRHKIY